MKKSSGYVYLICDPASDKFKIGMTKGPIEERISELQTGNPNELFISDYHYTNYPYRVESMLHSRYKSQNVLNEWFDLSSSDVSGFKNECNKIEDIIETLKENPFFAKGLK